VIARFIPQDGAKDLAPHAQRFTLRGSPEGASFPPLCPCCGNAADTPLTYSKVFRRVLDSDTPNSYVVTTVTVPFCATCSARHRALEPVPSRLSDLLTCLATGDIFGSIGLGLLAAFFAFQALKELFSGSAAGFLGLLGVAGVFALGAYLQGRHVWRDTTRYRVLPQTDVTRAFDFSDDVSPPLEPPRFVCTIRDERCASVFAQLNQDSHWQADGPVRVAETSAGRRRFWILSAVVAAIALLFLVVDYWKAH
jgi:hypothetical protein